MTEGNKPMKRLAPIIAATAVLGGLPLAPLAPASAAGTPTYTCQAVGEDGRGKVMGVQDCRASQGAITNGPFTGTSIVRSREYGFFFSCTAGGEADIPRTVEADGCTSRG
jgi:hypothetical protein